LLLIRTAACYHMAIPFDHRFFLGFARPHPPPPRLGFKGDKKVNRPDSREQKTAQAKLLVNPIKQHDFRIMHLIFFSFPHIASGKIR